MRLILNNTNNFCTILENHFETNHGLSYMAISKTNLLIVNRLKISLESPGSQTIHD